ncbi:MAG TPA: S8 family serine peptidase, partial [Kineosporiaceae bacterium]|nr:S8 family serine peptidase [Kineosporiaceae bacterium]
PYVSAAAALLKSARPALTGDQLATALTSTATDRGAPGKNAEFGAGIVNPVAALCSVGFCGTATPSPKPVTPSVSPTPSITPSGTPTVTPSVTPKPTVTPTPLSSSSIQVRSLPTGAVFGSTVTASAALTVAGKAIAAAPVQVCTRLPTSGYACVSHVSDASGVITARIPVTGNQFVKFVYPGSALVAGTATVEAPLAALSNVAVSGGRATMTATVSPLLGQGLLIERLSGSQWTALTRATLPNAGATARSTVSVTRLPAGTYRLTVQGTGTLTSTVSAAVTIT